MSVRGARERPTGAKIADPRDSRGPGHSYSTMVAEVGLGVRMLASKEKRSWVLPPQAREEPDRPGR